MPTEPERPVTTFILVPERDLGHAIAKKLREDPRVQVCGISTDPEKDIHRIWEANPDVIVGDWEAGGLEFVFSIILGFLGGRWLDGKLGTHPWLALAGLGFGLVAGFRFIYRAAKRMNAEAGGDGAFD